MSFETRVPALRAEIPGFAGEVVAPGDPGYDRARAVQDDAIDRWPALVARCTGPEDVAAAIRHARASGLPVTVRGGGHGRDGFAVADDVLVIDLTPMRAVDVDPVSRRARVQGGATWRELDAATGVHGLAVTGARLPSVGVAGFTIGSGSGWLERKLGLAPDLVRSARVVAADGRVVTASEEEHPELLWALRGGGPGFGVVTELEFELFPLPGVVGGMLAWPADRAPEIGAAYAELMAGAPDDLTGGLALMSAPPAPFIPEALHGAPLVAVLAVWTGAAEDAAAAIAPLGALDPVVDAVRPVPYAVLQGMFESPEPFTARMHGEGGFLRGLDGDVVAAFAELQASKPAPMGSLLLQPMGGAFARGPEGGTPLGWRDAPWAWQAGAAWFEPERDDAVRDWAAGLSPALARWSYGEPYPNFMPGPDPDRLRASYGDAVWDRLRAIRAEWDPDDVFSAGHAIPLPGA